MAEIAALNTLTWPAAFVLAAVAASAAYVVAKVLS